MIEDNQLESTNNRESSKRWQARTIEQLGYAINLILGLSATTLGFVFSILLYNKITYSQGEKWLLSVSAIFAFLSIMIALICIVNRLQDFRTTAEIARIREDNSDDPRLKSLRIYVGDLGRKTWDLFLWQIATFGISIFVLALAIGEVLIDC